jgi:membrane fusion protein, multidrug efflux system
MKNRSGKMFAAAARIALLAVCAGCGQTAAERPGRPPSPAQVATAQKATVPVMVETFGRLRAQFDVDIEAQVSGKIVESPFAEGGAVKRGDVLFRIEPDAYRAAVDQAQGQVAAARAGVAQSRATLDRNKTLLEQALISKEDYSQLETSAQTAEATLAQAEAALHKAQIDLDRCEIRSPIDGVTGKRLVDVGNLAGPGGGQPLVNVRSIDKLFLDFTLSESYLPAVRRAMQAGEIDVMVGAESEEGTPGLARGVVVAMDNAVDGTSGTISLRARVDNPDGTLWPGQFAYAYPVLETLTDAVVVPSTAIANGKDGPYAFAVVDGKAELRPVERGPAVLGATVVRSGVAAGDVVVTQGQLGIWPGAVLAVQEKADAKSQAEIDKRMADPNVAALAHVLGGLGESPEQIGILLGLPASAASQLLAK